jgi:hypothetical protein
MIHRMGFSDGQICKLGKHEFVTFNVREDTVIKHGFPHVLFHS